MGLASLVFTNSIDMINPENYPDAGQMSFQTIIWAGMGIMNLIAIALTIAVPLITNSLVMNTGSIAPAITPFAAAGAAGGALMGKLAAKGATKAAKTGGTGVANMGSNIANKALSSVANNEALRDAMPGVNSALSGFGMPHPAKQRLADGVKNSEGPRPGSGQHKLDTLEKTAAVQSAKSSRPSSVVSNGTNVDAFGESSKQSTVNVSDKKLDELQLEPMESNSSSSVGSGDTVSESKSASSTALNVTDKTLSATNEELELTALESASSTQSEEPATSSKSKQRKGVFIDKTLKAQGKRPSTKA